jgi:hypothetical protein
MFSADVEFKVLVVFVKVIWPSAVITSLFFNFAASTFGLVAPSRRSVFICQPDFGIIDYLAY